MQRFGWRTRSFDRKLWMRRILKEKWVPLLAHSIEKYLLRILNNRTAFQSESEAKKTNDAVTQLMNVKFEVEEMIEKDLSELDNVRKQGRKTAALVNELLLKVAEMKTYCPNFL